MTEEVEKDLVEMLIDNNCAMRKAGNELAIAAMRVVNEYDGVHRLALAVSEWSKVIANEGKRGGEFYEGFDWGELPRS